MADGMKSCFKGHGMVIEHGVIPREGRNLRACPGQSDYSYAYTGSVV